MRTRVEPRLEDDDSRRLVDVRARLLAMDVCGAERAPRLHRGEPLVDELDRCAGRVGDLLRDEACLSSGLALASLHVERQPHEHVIDLLGFHESCECTEQLRAIATVERAARVRKHPEVVGDGHAHADSSQIERARLGHFPAVLPRPRWHAAT